MINGAHVIVYSKDADADKAFIKNVLKFKYVDVHQGWLIFKLPPRKWRFIRRMRMTGMRSIS
jgi:hypothetical protein